MTRKFFIIIIFLTILAPLTVSAESASKTLDKIAEKISSAPSIQADYTLSSITDGSVSGSLIIAGDKFTMASPGIMSWYDGTTQWTYIKADNEVNVLTPSPDELAMVNPFIIIKSFKKNYAVKSEKVNGTIRLIFTAKDKTSPIQSASIIISDATSLPQNIELTMSDRRHISILLTNVNIGKKLPVKYFQFDKTQFPKAEIIDLR